MHFLTVLVLKVVHCAAAVCRQRACPTVGLWGPVGTYGDLWGSLGTYGELGGPRGPVGTDGDLWGPMGTYGSLWGPLGAYVDLLGAMGPMGTYGDLWRCLASGESSGEIGEAGEFNHLNE